MYIHSKGLKKKLLFILKILYIFLIVHFGNKSEKIESINKSNQNKYFWFIVIGLTDFKRFNENKLLGY